MKFTKLLALCTFWLAGVGSAMAEVADAGWTVKQPTVTFADYVVGTEYYLYNADAKMFFVGANDWNTRASVATKGYKVTFVESADAPAGTVEFTDYVETQNAQKSVFATADGAAIWVDNATETYRFWAVEKVGDAYRLSNPVLENTFLGWKGSYSDTRLYLIDAANGGVDWKFVTVDSYTEFLASDDYAAYVSSVDAYNLAAELKGLLEDAEKIEADVATALAVYNNTASTEDELKAAIEATKQAIEKRKQEIVDAQYDNATAANPVNVTDKFLKNVDFATSLTDGWSGTAFGAYNGKENAEHYSKTYNTYQALKGVKKGVYAFGANAFYRAGNAGPAYENYKAQNEASRYAKIYATVGEETSMNAIVSPFTAGLTAAAGTGSESSVKDGDVTYYIPNDMVAAEYYMHTLGKYANKLFIEVLEDETDLTVGVKKETTTDGDWSIFDDFSLTYYGKGTDAYQVWLDETIAMQFPDFQIGENDLYTEKYLNELEAARLGKTATSKAEVEAALAVIEPAWTAMQKNLDLWKQLQAKMTELKTYTVNQEYANQADNEEVTEFANAFFDLQDYEEEEYPAIIAALELTNEELEAEIQKVADMIARFNEAVKNDLKPHTKVTDFLVNADFEQGNTGWQGASSITAFSSGAAEAYEKKDFDLYQVVKGMKPGVYSISLQGFYRLGGNDAAFADYKNAMKSGNPQPPVAWVYLNDNRTALNNVYDIIGDERIAGDRGVAGTAANAFYVTKDGPDAWAGTDDDENVWSFPNGMGSSHDCFVAGMYKKAAYGLIRAGEDLRIGIKGSLGSWQWAIWDNFELTFEGNDFNTIKPLLEDAVAAIDAQVKTVDDAAAEGEQAMGKDVRDKIAIVKDAAAKAIAAGDGDAAFDALSDALALQEAITASAALFVQLTDELGQIETALIDATNEAYKAETNLWYNDILDKVAEGQLTDAEAKEILDQVAERKAKLAQPDPALADDTNTFDVTNVIVNPDYETTTGWSGTAAGYGESCAEVYNANFDYYQDLNYLNEGTYEVRVQGFYRAGSSVDDYKTYTEAPDHKNYAFIYAMASDSVVRSIPMARLASLAAPCDSTMELASGYVYAQTPDSTNNNVGYYVANTMATAQTEFSNGNYKNEGLFVKVAADGKLRIGIKKEVQLDTNWTIWDSWQLIYYGKDSQQALTGDASASIDNAIGEVQTVNVEYFTLDGRKALRAQKGILIQKMTLSNGNVIVKKVRK